MIWQYPLSILGSSAVYILGSFSMVLLGVSRRHKNCK